MQDFHRIKRLPPYVFSEVNTMKAKARACGEDIIDLGMGNPDLATPKHIVEKLTEVAKNPKSHRYSASAGIRGLRLALSAYYERRFNVTINPDEECVAQRGSYTSSLVIENVWYNRDPNRITIPNADACCCLLLVVVVATWESRLCRQYVW